METIWKQCEKNVENMEIIRETYGALAETDPKSAVWSPPLCFRHAAWGFLQGTRFKEIFNQGILKSYRNYILRFPGNHVISMFKPYKKKPAIWAVVGKWASQASGTCI